MSSQSATPALAKSRMTLSKLRRLHQQGEKIAMLTAYDASFARLFDLAGVDVILVGDTLGQMIQGRSSTLPVTMDDMIYHSAAVARGNRQAFLIGDMPFMSYSSVADALHNAGRFLKQAEVQMVKLECSAAQESVIKALADEGIPVCAHLGLRPQSVHKLGGYRVQGRDDAAAAAMLAQAERLEAAGADMLLVEAIPASLAGQITAAATVPVIGIGAGAACDGQVLVLYDLLGISPPPLPSFVKNFLLENDSIQSAIAAYVAAVKAGEFPTAQQSYQ